MAIGYVITSISVSEAVEVSKYLCLWHINSTKDLQIFRWNWVCSWHLALNLNSPYLLAKVSCNVLLNQKAFLEKATLDMRPVPTKWETSRKILFESYKQIRDVQTLSFKMIYNILGLLPHLGSKTHYFLEKFLCFLLIFEMFNESYLLWFNGDLSLILWEWVS